MTTPAANGNTRASGNAGDDSSQRRETVESFEQRLVDITTTPADQFEELCQRKHRVLRHYLDDQLESCYLLFLSGNWRLFYVPTVIGGLLCIFWISIIVSILVGREAPELQLSLYAAIPMAIATFLYSVGYHFYTSWRVETVRIAYHYKDQATFLRRAEWGQTLLVYLASSFYFAGIERDHGCRGYMEPRGERNYCQQLQLSNMLRIAAMPVILTRMRVFHIVHIVVFVLVGVTAEVLHLKHGPRAETALRVALFAVPLLIMGALVTAAFVIQDNRRRLNFEDSLRRKRVANAIAFHHRRMRRTLAAVLPDDCLLKFTRGEPIIDQRAHCTIGVTRIFDYPVWSTQLLPQQSVAVFDLLCARFDEVLATYGCHKIQQTDDLYVTSCDLRRLSGRPNATSKSRAFRLIQLSTFQQKLVRSIRGTTLRVATLCREKPLALSIGIHHGSASGSFLGAQKLQYCAAGPAFEGALALARRAAAGETLVSVSALQLCGCAGTDAGVTTASNRDAIELLAKGGGSDEELSEKRRPTAGRREGLPEVITLTEVGTGFPEPLEARRLTTFLNHALKRNAIDDDHNATDSPEVRSSTSVILDDSSCNERSTGSESGGESLRAPLVSFLGAHHVCQKGEDVEWQDVQDEHSPIHEENIRRKEFLERQGQLWKKRRAEEQTAEAEAAVIVEAPPQHPTQATEKDWKQEKQQQQQQQQSYPSHEEGCMGSLRLTFSSESSEKEFWRQQRLRSVLSLDPQLYFVACLFPLLGGLMEEVITLQAVGTLVLALLLVATLHLCRYKMQDANKRRREAWFLPSWADWILQLLICAAATTGVFSMRCMFNDKNITLQNVVLPMALVLGASRVRWYVAALSIVVLNVISFLVVTQFEPELAAARVPGLTIFIFIWVAWDREKSRRRAFVDEYILAALRQDLEQQLLWHRGLLHMLVPEFVVERVLQKKHDRRAISLYYSCCVVLELRAPAVPPAHFVTVADQTKRMLAVESLLSALPHHELLCSIHAVGDTMRVAGPTAQPCIPDGPELFQSTADVQKFRHAFRNDDMSASLHVAKALLLLLGLLRRHEGAGLVDACGTNLEGEVFSTQLSAFLGIDEGFAAVVGVQPPSFEITGVVSRTVHSVLEAAPPGFQAVSTNLRYLVDTEGPEICAFLRDECGIRLGSQQRWRLRGCGYVPLFPLLFFSPEERDNPQ